MREKKRNSINKENESESSKLTKQKQVDDKSLDFIYIDSQDYNTAVMDLIEWGRKLRKGA